MKGFVVGLIVAGSLLLVGGGVLVAVGYSNGQGVKIETKEYNDVEAFNKFNIDLTIAEFEVKPSEDSTRKVIVDETRYDQHTVEVVDNTLTIKGVNKRKWYEQIFTWGFFQKVKVTVYAPEGSYEEFEAKGHTGAFIVPSNYTFDTFNVSTSTGSIKSGAKVNNELVAKTSTGSVNLDGADAKSMDLKTSTGSINVKNANVAELINARSSTGSINLENVTAQNLKTSVSSGSTRLKNVKVTEHIDSRTSSGTVYMEASDANTLFVKTSTGSVNLKLLTNKIFDAHSRTGSVKVPQTTSGGLCEVHTTTGSIRAEIAQSGD